MMLRFILVIIILVISFFILEDFKFKKSKRKLLDDINKMKQRKYEEYLDKLEDTKEKLKLR